MKLKEAAQKYEPTTIKNIAELQKVSIEENIVEETFKDKDGQEYRSFILTRNNEKYRVPTEVIKQLKMIIEKKPALQEFSVGKNGTGLNTTYTVIPL